MRIAAIATATALMSLSMATRSSAAEITLLSSSAIDAVLNEVVPQFERSSGHKVTMRLDIASRLRKEVASGAKFDAAILVGSLDTLIKQGRVSAGTSRALGRSGYGVAVRAGASKPDISTTEAFKRTMLSATSVGYTEGGGSGAYFLRLLDRLGIADPMKPKLRGGKNMQAEVARGAVEMTVNGIVPILRAPGIDLVGPLPPELQSYSIFFAGVSSKTEHREAATALLDFLTAPAATAVFRKRGVEAVP